MVLQIIRLKSNLPYEELLKRARKREPRFKAIPGLLQKYYVKISDSQLGGIYVWDTRESLKAFRDSELAASIPEAYEVIETPDIETLDIIFQLRD